MPKPMFAATPPRRICKSSTKNDSDTLCNWSAINESLNRPGKVIKWSVATDPVIAMRTIGEPNKKIHPYRGRGGFWSNLFC